MQETTLLIVVALVCLVTLIISYIVATNAGSVAGSSSGSAAGANAGTAAVTSVTTQSISNTATSVATSVASNVATSTVNSEMSNYASTSSLSNYATQTQVSAAIAAYDSNGGSVTTGNGCAPLRGGGFVNFGNVTLADGASNTSSPTVGNLTITFPRAFSQVPSSYNLRFENSNVNGVVLNVTSLTQSNMIIGYSIPASTKVNQPIFWQAFGQA